MFYFRRSSLDGILRSIVLIVIVFLVSAPLYADWVTDSVSAGNDPRAICVNPSTNKIYVANYNSDNVTVIDGATDSTTTVVAGDAPFAICINPNTNRIYTANQYSDDVTVIDGATNSTTTVAAGDAPRAISVNPKTNKIYVANYNSDNVTVIDGATNSTTTVVAGDAPFAISINPNTNKVYVANRNSDNVTVIDGATNDTTTVVAGDAPYAVSVNPNTNKIYVANYNSDDVTVIDGATNDTTIIAVGTNPWAISVNPNTNKIYATSQYGEIVTVIDGVTNDTTRVAAGTNPHAICVNPNTNKIYVANLGSDNVTVIDGATNLTTIVAAGDYPYGICVNPSTNKIYAANQYSDNVTVIDGATNSTTTVAAGDYPRAICVNPSTNKIYVANYFSDNVTVIDGATNSTATVAVGDQPRAICVNPITDRIYVSNLAGDDVTVIDGATNATTIVTAGDNPQAICVNPNTNKIYVANLGSDNVTVIDGATNLTTTVAAGNIPGAICVNPSTNRIYVANRNSDDVTVIDGATNDTTTVAVGDFPGSICVNPNTNKIYVANENSDNVTVIDGATNSTTTVVAGDAPNSIYVNPNTNKIYVANGVSDDVTVIDGVTNDTTTVAVGDSPGSICVNPNTNKIYVVNVLNDNVTVIDGATLSTTTVSAGDAPPAICVNSSTNRIYVANGANSDDVTVIEEVVTYESPLATSITPFPGNITETPFPEFTGNSINSRSPHNCNIMKVLYQIDETQKVWEEAYITSGGGTEWVSWTAQATEPLTTGFHSLYVVALDMTSATINMTENFAGSIQPYYFFVASSYVDIEEYSLLDSYKPEDPWTTDGTVSLSFTVRNTSERVLEHIKFSSSDLVSGSNHIHGNAVTFSPSVIPELQPGYTEKITATVPISIGTEAGTYTGQFGTSTGRSSPDYVNVSIAVDSLVDLDIQDYGANLSANRMILPGVENSVVIGRFNLSSPNTKEDNYDPYDGPGNASVDSIIYVPDTLFAYGGDYWMLPSEVSMVDSVVTLSSGSAYQCILQVLIPPGLPSGRDFVGDFTVGSGSIDDKFSLTVRVVEPGSSSGTSEGLRGEGLEEGNRIYWSNFDLNETSYNVYRSDLQDVSFVKLNSSEISQHEYLDADVNIGEEYLYKLGAKVGGDRELLIGPITVMTIGGSGVPGTAWLFACEPNPFRSFTRIRYQIARGDEGPKQHVSLNVYNVSGRKVKSLVDEERLPGFYSVDWNGRDDNDKKLPNGIYFYRLEVADFTSAKKAVLMR
jgi:YVTN family beta-propeller protein